MKTPENGSRTGKFQRYFAVFATADFWLMRGDIRLPTRERNALEYLIEGRLSAAPHRSACADGLMGGTRVENYYEARGFL